MAKPSFARVRELFRYDPSTGILTWIATGRRAGTKEAHGYRIVQIDGQKHREHRVIWLYVHGVWPLHDIDHINGIPSDNRIVNLRDVTRKVNRQNQRRPLSRNKCGVLGVSFWRGKYRASLGTKVIGRFTTADEAHAAYVKAKRLAHEGCTI